MTEIYLWRQPPGNVSGTSRRPRIFATIYPHWANSLSGTALIMDVTDSYILYGSSALSAGLSIPKWSNWEVWNPQKEDATSRCKPIKRLLINSMNRLDNSLTSFHGTYIYIYIKRQSFTNLIAGPLKKPICRLVQNDARAKCVPMDAGHVRGLTQTAENT